MKKMEKASEILCRCNVLGDALEMIGYTLDALLSIDNREEDLRRMIGVIESGMECLSCYHNETTDAMDKFFADLCADEHPEISQQYKEDRLLWIYRHMNGADKEKLDRYCDEFHLLDSEEA